MSNFYSSKTPQWDAGKKMVNASQYPCEWVASGFADYVVTWEKEYMTSGPNYATDFVSSDMTKCNTIPSSANGQFPDWWLSSSYSGKLANVVVLAAASNIDDIVNLSQSRGAPTLYAYDGSTGSYGHLSQFFEEEVAVARQTGITFRNGSSDDYGTVNASVQHTYTVKNVGTIATSTLTTSLSGAKASLWSIVADQCNNTTLDPGASCTITLGFPTALQDNGGNALLQVAATVGGTTQNGLTAGFCSTAGKTWCDTSVPGSCDDLTSDVDNCGSCGDACQAPDHGVPLCNSSQCDYACPLPYAKCYGGFCVNCAPPHGYSSCANDTCVWDGCDPGYTQCGSQCVDLSGDGTNCGTCGHACQANSTCSGGACVCNSGYSLCNGVCVVESNDAHNCGACGNVCPGADDGTGSCSGGTCVCNSGYCPKNGACVSESSDVDNCGSCGHSCGGIANGSPTCSGGVCGVQCNCGYIMCGGTCVDASVNGNCGACGARCRSGFTCTFEGGCDYACDNGNAPPP